MLFCNLYLPCSIMNRSCLVRFIMTFNGELHVLWGVFNGSHWLTGAVRMRNERFTICLLFTAARHGMVLPWILLRLFNAAILRAPFVLGKGHTIDDDSNITNICFRSSYYCSLGDLFLSVFWWRCFAVICNLLWHIGYYVYHQFCR